MTPNLLARTIETVEGGGLVVLLLRSLSSLTSLYTMVMVCIHIPYVSAFFFFLMTVKLLFQTKRNITKEKAIS